MFAAIVPMSSGGQIYKAEQLKDIPIWAFYGAIDDIIPVEQMTRMINGWGEEAVQGTTGPLDGLSSLSEI
ncbi:hypothetical protein ACI5FR_30805 [Paenibacillus sp. HJGM_3]